MDIFYNTSGRVDKIIREPEDRSKVIAKNAVRRSYPLDHIAVWDICKVDAEAKVHLIRCQRKIKRKLGRSNIKELLGKNSPELMKDTNTQIQEAQ